MHHYSNLNTSFIQKKLHKIFIQFQKIIEWRQSIFWIKLENLHFCLTKLEIISIEKNCVYFILGFPLKNWRQTFSVIWYNYFIYHPYPTNFKSSILMWEPFDNFANSLQLLILGKMSHKKVPSWTGRLRK